MFWGLVLEPGKKYKQVVEKSFHISMACLQPNKNATSDYVSFILHNNNHDFILCNLSSEKFVQTQLDLNFAAGDEITFETRGAKNSIHLSGYVIEDEEEEDDFGNMEDLNGMEESADEEEEVTDLVPIKKLDVKRKASLEPLTQNTKKAKQAQITEVDESSEDDYDDDDDDDDDDNNMEAEEDSDDLDEEDDEADQEDDSSSMESDESPAKPLPVKNNRTPEQQKKKNQQKSPAPTTPQTNGKTPKKNKGQETPTANNTPKAAKTPSTPAAGTPKKNVLEGGIISEDLKVGQGQFAKSGKMVSVFYSGRLKSNNKQFDSCTQGNGFKFRLGKGEVIKGWDIGVNGMKVGGKRRITIPAALAYGAKGSMPQIPPNSTLVFEVELKNVN